MKKADAISGVRLPESIGRSGYHLEKLEHPRRTQLSEILLLNENGENSVIVAIIPSKKKV